MSLERDPTFKEGLWGSGGTHYDMSDINHVFTLTPQRAHRSAASATVVAMSMSPRTEMLFI